MCMGEGGTDLSSIIDSHKCYVHVQGPEWRGLLERRPSDTRIRGEGNSSLETFALGLRKLYGSEMHVER